MNVLKVIFGFFPSLISLITAFFTMLSVGTELFEADRISQINRIEMLEQAYANGEIAPVDEASFFEGDLEKEIEAGYVKEVYAVRLGYVMYSNPDMTDYAWAIPRWVIDCSYESDEFRELKKKHGEDFSADSEIVWESRYFLQMPIDAQSGNPIIYALPTEEILRVPEIITWNEVK